MASVPCHGAPLERCADPREGVGQNGNEREPFVGEGEAARQPPEQNHSKLRLETFDGDKTGSGDYGSANDVAVIWAPGRAPLIVCVYLTQTKASPHARSATIAAVGRIVAGMAR